MKFYVISLMLLVLVGQKCCGQYNVTKLENDAYKVTITNFHDYFNGYGIVAKYDRVVQAINTNNLTDSVIFRLNRDKEIQIIEIKSKDQDMIKTFKNSLSTEYSIYDEETMKVYFNEKKQISFNFYTLGDYKIVELFLNERLNLED